MTLVILPGLDGTGLLLKEFISAISGEVEVLAIEYPADYPYGYKELAEIAHAALPRDRPYCMLAESISGPIAIALAATNPAGLAGLILCASFATNPQPILAGLFALPGMPLRRIPTFLSSALTFGSHDSAERRALLKQALARVSVPVLRTRLNAIVDVNVADQLAALNMPFLYLRGTEDMLVYRSQSEAMRRRTPAMEIRDFAAPHFILQTRPSEAAGAIYEFMRRSLGNCRSSKFAGDSKK